MDAALLSTLGLAGGLATAHVVEMSASGLQQTWTANSLAARVQTPVPSVTTSSVVQVFETIVTEAVAIPVSDVVYVSGTTLYPTRTVTSVVDTGPFSSSSTTSTTSVPQTMITAHRTLNSSKSLASSSSTMTSTSEAEFKCPASAFKTLLASAIVHTENLMVHMAQGNQFVARQLFGELGGMLSGMIGDTKNACDPFNDDSDEKSDDSDYDSDEVDEESDEQADPHQRLQHAKATMKSLQSAADECDQGRKSAAICKVMKVIESLEKIHKST